MQPNGTAEKKNSEIQEKIALCVSTWCPVGMPLTQQQQIDSKYHFLVLGLLTNPIVLIPPSKLHRYVFWHLILWWILPSEKKILSITKTCLSRVIGDWIMENPGNYVF